MFSAIFVAAGGLDIMFPKVEDPEKSQLYRLYVYIEPKGGNFSAAFYSEITVFNSTSISDKFSVRVDANTTAARGSGNLLWSLNTIDGITVEIESTVPVGFGFYWYSKISSSDASELGPSETNAYGWIFEYTSSYWIKIQLGPKLTGST